MFPPMFMMNGDESFEGPWSRNRAQFRCGPQRGGVRHPAAGRCHPFNNWADLPFYVHPWGFNGYPAGFEAETKKPEPPKKSTNDNDGFQVRLEVKHFEPNEISVKVVDQTIVIEAKHEEKEDEQGFVFRHFIRRYKLPKEYDVNDVVTTLSVDGVLTIKAPPKAINPAETNERLIQIQPTGPAKQPVESNQEMDDMKPVEDKKD